VALPPFQAVLDAHGPGVRAYLVARLGPSDGEDAYQDTVLSALSAYPRLRDPTAARAWLLRIAERTALDEHRRRAREARRPAAADLATPPPADPIGAWERARRLPDKQRRALALRVALDLPYREIAELMGTSPEAARRSVHEALATLRRDLG